MSLLRPITNPSFNLRSTSTTRLSLSDYSQKLPRSKSKNRASYKVRAMTTLKVFTIVLTLTPKEYGPTFLKTVLYKRGSVNKRNENAKTRCYSCFHLIRLNSRISIQDKWHMTLVVYQKSSVKEISIQ